MPEAGWARKQTALRLLAEAFQGLQLHKRRLIFGPVDVPLDGDQILKVDYSHLAGIQVNLFRPGNQVVVVAKRLYLTEEVQRPLIGVEGEIRAKGQALRVQAERQIGWRPTKRGV